MLSSTSCAEKWVKDKAGQIWVRQSSMALDGTMEGLIEGLIPKVVTQIRHSFGTTGGHLLTAKDCKLRYTLGQALFRFPNFVGPFISRRRLCATAPGFVAAAANVTNFAALGGLPWICSADHPGV